MRSRFCPGFIEWHPCSNAGFWVRIKEQSATHISTITSTNSLSLSILFETPATSDSPRAATHNPPAQSPSPTPAFAKPPARPPSPDTPSPPESAAEKSALQAPPAKAPESQRHEIPQKEFPNKER